jgi:ParB/RepB/Spo0J family partition protein
VEINVNDIFVDDSWNCRGRFNPQEVRELAESIQRDGQLQEVIVTPFDHGQPYRLIAGFRRYTAIARLLKRKTIRASVVDIDEERAKVINLIENLERDNLNVLQEALAIEALYPQSRYGCRTVAENLGRHTNWVLQRRKLLDLPEDIQQKFAAGSLKISRIGAVAESSDPRETCRQLQKRKHARAPLPGMRRRNMGDIKRMIAHLIECGFEGLPTRLLAWVNGYVSDEQIHQEIDRLLKEGR